ncbi:MAG: hypothetical protein IKW62_01505 [Clostridia bacterium]|nr:hypothetical protein [Clostridia bacterium]
MKKFNYNKIVFIFVAVLIVSGLFSKPLVTGLAKAGLGFLRDKDVDKCIQNVNNSAEEIRYKGIIIDIQSLKDRLTGVRKVEKSDSTVVRLPNDYLSYYYEDLSEELVEKTADSCENLKEFTESLDIPLMYVYVPVKSYFDETMHTEYIKDCDKFIELLEDRNVHTLNFEQKMREKNLAMEDAYFITDHHWKIETAFWAFSEICSELEKEYGFEYDKEATDLSNYSIKVYEDWFLGSEGKKVGRFFTPLGVDDFSLITPKFQTNLTVSDEGQPRTGEFENTILKLKSLSKKSYHKSNSYATYSHRDFPVQVIENNLAPENSPKVMVIKDSYANAVSPFLSLVTKSIHNIDIREMHGDERVESVFEYIKENRPDYVMVLYSGLNVSEDDFSKYDFK